MKSETYSLPWRYIKMTKYIPILSMIIFHNAFSLRCKVPTYFTFEMTSIQIRHFLNYLEESQRAFTIIRKWGKEILKPTYKDDQYPICTYFCCSGVKLCVLTFNCLNTVCLTFQCHLVKFVSARHAWISDLSFKIRVNIIYVTRSLIQSHNKYAFHMAHTANSFTSFVQKAML